MDPGDDDGNDLEDFWEAVRPGAQDLEAYWSSVRPQPRRHPGAGTLGPAVRSALDRFQAAVDELGIIPTLRPWDDEAIEAREMDSEDIEDLWQTTTADEFIYAIGDDYLIITPRAYFERTGTLYDGELFIDHLLPPGFDQVSEGTFVPGEPVMPGEPRTTFTLRPAAAVDAELQQRGFVPSPELQAFISHERHP